MILLVVEPRCRALKGKIFCKVQHFWETCSLHMNITSLLLCQGHLMHTLPYLYKCTSNHSFLSQTNPTIVVFTSSLFLEMTWKKHFSEINQRKVLCMTHTTITTLDSDFPHSLYYCTSGRLYEYLPSYCQTALLTHTMLKLNVTPVTLFCDSASGPTAARRRLHRCIHCQIIESSFSSLLIF